MQPLMSMVKSNPFGDYRMRFVPVALLLSALACRAGDLPADLAPYFKPPAEFAKALGNHKSPLTLDDGTPAKTPADWVKRREEIKTYWHGLMGTWPPIIAKPKVEYLDQQQIEGIPVTRLRLETAPGRHVNDAYLLKPATGSGPFPAVVVVFYEANTAIGKGKTEYRDYAIQLAKRGFMTLSLGGDPNTYYPDKERCRIQPLSFHAYEAANCHSFLAGLPLVDKNRIGVVGHSYGGKWAMFAACLHEPFACGAWSDPGIVFDEKRPNVNYWEPWYLGFDPALKEQRKRGVPDSANPRTGPYKRLMAEGRDLTDLHALMAPRPFLVSGGSEDPPRRWESLNHAVAVNRLLGMENRVGMTNRPDHSPNAKDNEVLYRFFEHALGKGK